MFALLRHILCHSFLSDFSGVVPQNGPCSIRVVGEAVTALLLTEECAYACFNHVMLPVLDQSMYGFTWNCSIYANMQQEHPEIGAGNRLQTSPTTVTFLMFKQPSS
jgi:hypothetical protein